MTIFQAFRLTFNFLPIPSESNVNWKACSKPPSRDIHRKASYPRAQQRDQMLVEPKSCDQGRHENEALTRQDKFILSLSTNTKTKLYFAIV